LESILTNLGFSPDLAAAIHLDTLGRLLLAAVLGGVVGTEREISGKPAGLRTNLLICVGAALIGELSLAMGSEGSGDPGRMAAQVVSGIGFIGAGTIIQSRGKVVGLTTAATLWVVAAIGLAVGLGAYVQAVGTAVLVLIALFALRSLERVFSRRWVKRRYAIVVDGERPMEALLAAVKEMGLAAHVEGIERRPEGVDVLVRLDGPAATHDGLMPRLAALQPVRRARRG
jgi:putative Mg2+ transporter-C (MgtC) family protein